MPSRTAIALRLIAVLAVVGVVSLLLARVRRTDIRPVADTGGIRVVASIYPLAEFAQTVGGEFVNVRLLAKAGVEAHDYEPTPEDLATTETAHLLLYQGGGFDAWAERIAREHDRAVNVVDALRKRGVAVAEQDAVDPHVWLDPTLAAEEVRILADAFRAVDPEHGDAYTARSAVYVQKLEQLAELYRAGLASCARRTFVVTHAAFHYLARAYNLTMLSITGLSPLDEPSPLKLGNVIAEARRAGATVVFYEPLEGPRLAETVAREFGAAVRPLSPIEGLTREDERAGKTYSDLMRENLKQLQEALECPTAGNP